MTNETLPSRYEVWAFRSGVGEELLGEYRETKYALNRANNYQSESNEIHERVYCQIYDNIDGRVIHQTYGEFVQICEWCERGTGITLRGETCPKCKGEGCVAVVTGKLEQMPLWNEER